MQHNNIGDIQEKKKQGEIQKTIKFCTFLDGFLNFIPP